VNRNTHSSSPLPLRGRSDRDLPIPSPACGGGDREGEREMTESSKKPDWQVTRTMRSRARWLRRDLTDAERIVWATLRAHRLNGAGFRRQKPIGTYIADFVCEASKLIVELDGGQHFEAEQQKRDMRRDAFLRGKGYRVLRFNNHDVMSNKNGVLDTIAAAIASSPSPTLPRKRGRGRDTTSGETRGGGAP